MDTDILYKRLDKFIGDYQAYFQQYFFLFSLIDHKRKKSYYVGLENLFTNPSEKIQTAISFFKKEDGGANILDEKYNSGKYYKALQSDSLSIKDIKIFDVESYFNFDTSNNKNEFLYHEKIIVQEKLLNYDSHNIYSISLPIIGFGEMVGCLHLVFEPFDIEKTKLNIEFIIRVFMKLFTEKYEEVYLLTHMNPTVSIDYSKIAQYSESSFFLSSLSYSKFYRYSDGEDNYYSVLWEMPEEFTPAFKQYLIEFSYFFEAIYGQSLKLNIGNVESGLKLSIQIHKKTTIDIVNKALSAFINSFVFQEAKPILSLLYDNETELSKIQNINLRHLSSELKLSYSNLLGKIKTSLIKKRELESLVQQKEERIEELEFIIRFFNSDIIKAIKFENDFGRIEVSQVRTLTKEIKKYLLEGNSNRKLQVHLRKKLSNNRQLEVVDSLEKIFEQRDNLEILGELGLLSAQINRIYKDFNSSIITYEQFTLHITRCDRALLDLINQV